MNHRGQQKAINVSALISEIRDKSGKYLEENKLHGCSHDPVSILRARRRNKLSYILHRLLKLFQANCEMFSLLCNTRRAISTAPPRCK